MNHETKKQLVILTFWTATASSLLIITIITYRKNEAKFKKDLEINDAIHKKNMKKLKNLGTNLDHQIETAKFWDIILHED